MVPECSGIKAYIQDINWLCVNNFDPEKTSYLEQFKSCLLVHCVLMIQRSERRTRCTSGLYTCFLFFFFVTSLLFSCFLLLKDIDPYRALGQRRMIFSSIIELDSGIAKKKKTKIKN